MNEWSQKYILDQKYSTAQVRCVIWKCTLRPIFGLKVDQDFDFIYCTVQSSGMKIFIPMHPYICWCITVTPFCNVRY